MEDMANLLLAERGTKKVGKLWARNFVKRQPQLQTRINRVFDYQRALCEDPNKILTWFELVRNVRAKYGIDDVDIYNFDKTGFMMGVITPNMVVTRAERSGKPKKIQPGNQEWSTVIQGINAQAWCIPPFIVVKAVYHLANWYSECDLPPDWIIKPTDNGWTNNETGLEWIQHFDKHTAHRKSGIYRMLVMSGHSSHLSAGFDRFCKEKKIIAISVPSHSSHILQPLDVGYFGPLKRAYSQQIEQLVKSHINHVTKVDFLIAFKAAFFTTMRETNTKAGFRVSRLVPLDPDIVLSKLDIKLRTPTPPGSPATTTGPWISQTPQNPTEAVSQSTLIKDPIARHHSSSPTPIYEAVDQLAKGT
jgi:hypothetical protein